MASAARFKGYEADSEFLLQEERDTGAPALALKVAADDSRFEREGWRVRKDGSRFWAHVIIDPIRSPDGKIIGHAQVTRDLTEHKAAEATFRRSEEQYRILVQGVTDYAIFMLDSKGRVAPGMPVRNVSRATRPRFPLQSFLHPGDLANNIPSQGLETAARNGRWEAERFRQRKMEASSGRT